MKKSDPKYVLTTVYNNTRIRGTIFFLSEKIIWPNIYSKCCTIKIMKHLLSVLLTCEYEWYVVLVSSVWQNIRLTDSLAGILHVQGHDVLSAQWDSLKDNGHESNEKHVSVNDINSKLEANVNNNMSFNWHLWNGVYGQVLIYLVSSFVLYYSGKNFEKCTNNWPSTYR